MKRLAPLTAVLILGGAALSTWGLFSPLVKFPLIGSIAYSQPDFGGSTGLAIVIVLLMVAAGGVLIQGICRPLGWCCAGLGAGLLLGTLHIRRAWVEDKLLQLADATGQMDAGVEALLAKMEFATGSYALATGLLFWGAGLCFQMFTRRKA